MVLFRAGQSELYFGRDVAVMLGGAPETASVLEWLAVEVVVDTRPELYAEAGGTLLVTS